MTYRKDKAFGVLKEVVIIKSQHVGKGDDISPQGSAALVDLSFCGINCGFDGLRAALPASLAMICLQPPQMIPPQQQQPAPSPHQLAIQWSVIF